MNYDKDLVVILAPTLKAVDRLIEAFALVTRQTPEARLCIVGRIDDPEYLGLLTARVEQLDLRTCVTFLPPMPQSELARYMARATALVLPSLSEGLLLYKVRLLAALLHRSG